MTLQKNVLDVVFHAWNVQPVDIFPDHIKYQRERVANFIHVDPALLQVKLVVVQQGPFIVLVVGVLANLGSQTPTKSTFFRYFPLSI